MILVASESWIVHSREKYITHVHCRVADGIPRTYAKTAQALETKVQVTLIRIVEEVEMTHALRARSFPMHGYRGGNTVAIRQFRAVQNRRVVQYVLSGWVAGVPNTTTSPCPGSRHLINHSNRMHPPWQRIRPDCHNYFRQSSPAQRAFCAAIGSFRSIRAGAHLIRETSLISLAQPPGQECRNHLEPFRSLDKTPVMHSLDRYQTGSTHSLR